MVRKCGAMLMTDLRKKKSLNKAYQKEIKHITKVEAKLQANSQVYEIPWRQALEDKVPEKVYGNLKKAFYMAFTIIFEKGLTIIEKTYNKEALQKKYQQHDVAIDSRRSMREFKKMRKAAGKSGGLNSAITTVEGVGLGILGIGLPDIVIFIGFLLKSVYEVALRYGYDYDRPEERMLILKMMSTAIQKNEKWIEGNEEVNTMLQQMRVPAEEELNGQVLLTSDAFAIDMLLLKFIQGLPVVGAVGGLSNPVYYRKIMQYVQVKYHKRYLFEKMRTLDEDTDEAE